MEKISKVFGKVLRRFTNNKKSWVKHHYSTEKDRKTKVPADDRKAACFCLMGAVFRYGGDNYELETTARRYLSEAIYEVFSTHVDPCLIENWNDRKGRTVNQVIKVVREARELAKAGGQ